MTAKVLVIDDDVTAQEVIASMLRSAGFTVQTLSSPIGATRTIRDHNIDIIVCDLNMPAMRGDAFARMFRKSSVMNKLRLVVISAAPREELESLEKEKLVDGVVHKADLHRLLVPLLRRLGGG